MKRLYVLVEGQTEEGFVNDLLASHLGRWQIVTAALRITTGRVGSVRAHRGGHAGKYSYIRRDLKTLLGHARPDAVTTMLDLYGLPADFPGLDRTPPGDCFRRAAHLEAAFGEDIADRRFLPNLVVHEFEGLLFSSPESIQSAFPETPVLAQLQAIAAAHASPEEINDSRATAPSRRLLALCPTYQKVRQGLLIAQRIGLDALRSRCRHFAAWLDRLEALGD